MSNKTKKTTDLVPNKDTKPEFYYINESVKNCEFSDYVRISSFPRGVILSFGQLKPMEGKFGIFREILLPFEVAESLATIIKNHINELVDKGALRETPIQKKGDK